jgi:hypothetical protein
MSRRSPSAGEIVSTAADTTGNLAGVVLAALFGPDGAVVGLALGPSVSLVFKQAVAQVGGWVSGRQADRVSEAIRVAASDLERYIAEGGEIAGAFASVDGDERSAADEIAEGVLQTVAFAYEQRKAPYLGHLLASLAVRPDISVADAHRLTRLVGELSYRQLACLSAIGSGEAKIDTIQAGVMRSLAKRDRMSAGIAEEVEELSNTHDLLGSRDSTQAGDIATSSGITLGHRTLPRSLALTERGYFLFELLRLDTLPDDDRRAVVGELLGMDTADLAT